MKHRNVLHILSTLCLAFCLAQVSSISAQSGCKDAYIDSVGKASVSFYYPSKVLGTAFSVAADRKVYFSSGNLQYNPGKDVWRFAEHQYDIIGNGVESGNAMGTYLEGSTLLVANGKTIEQQLTARATQDKWIDLFCYGTSGYEHSDYRTYRNTHDYEVAGNDPPNKYIYQPWEYEDRGNSKVVYDNKPLLKIYKESAVNQSLTGDYAECDWAWHNEIINGGCSSPSADPAEIVCYTDAHKWRLPTADEMAYVAFKRPNACELIGFATLVIADSARHGVILLPDDWSWDMPGPSASVLATWKDKWYAVISELGKCESVKSSAGTAESSDKWFDWEDNVLTEEEWEVFEEYGAIFFPAAGCFQFGRWRWYDGQGFPNQFAGYWTSTHASGDADAIKIVRFYERYTYGGKTAKGEFYFGGSSSSPIQAIAIRPVRNCTD